MFDTDKLAAQTLPLDSVLLDPNNPRLSDLEPSAGRVQEDRIAEPAVQQRVMDQMRDPRLDVATLKRSIRQVGFLGMDRVIVRRLTDGLYVVVEGNRRVAALKWLLDDHASGRDTLPEDLLNQVTHVDALLLAGPAAEAAEDQWLLQGLRHISGPKGWGPYQWARALQSLMEHMQVDVGEAADTLGVGRVRAARALEALRALETMREDATYGDYARPDMFSYFEEVMRRPAVRDGFLHWNRELGVFENEDNLELFYSWITPDADGERKLPRAIDVRGLAVVVAEEAALAHFKEPSGTLAGALALTAEYQTPDWQPAVRRAREALENIPTSALEELSVDDMSLIASLISLAQRRLNQATLLAAQGDLHE